MRIEPAHVNQVLAGNDGHLYEISSDVGNVVKDLKDIDRNLGVRLSEQGRYWVVYHQPDDRTTELVTTAKAYQGATGVWLGLDQRIVERIREISRSSYDYAREIEKQNARADRAKRERQREKLEQASDRALHEIRRVTGSKGRAFIRGTKLA